MSEPNWTDIMKYDGSRPEPPYDVCDNCAAYEARIAELEAMLSYEVAENVRLRSREVGDEVGNLLQEVADLKNELARVKAESLRVVADGEQCAVEIIPTGLRVAIHGRQGIFRRVGSGAAANPLRSFLLFEDCHSGNEIEVEYGSLGTPVRLERWEDEG